MSGRLPPTINSSNTSTQQQPSYPQHLYHPSHQSSSLNPSPLTMMSAPSPVDNNNPTIINNSNPMTNTTNPLLSHCKERIHQTKQRHAYQLNQLDLNLETTPRDSRYSPTLLELMRKEEVLLKEGGGSGGSGGGAAAGGNQQQLSQATKTLMQKVDDSLKIETKHFFAKLTAANLKKWEMLQEKLKKERDQLKSEFYRELQNQQISLSSIPNPSLIPLNQIYKKPSPGQIITAEDLAKEEERLNLDYHQRWYQIEMIHLQEAFRLQSCKIDSDWGQHERTIRNEYETKKASLLPKGSSDFQSHQNNLDNEQQQQQRWHSAEKQKTLIHTAPVFTPSTHQLNRPSSSNVAKKRDSASPSALNHELEKLEREYQETLNSLYRQKGDAKRWLLRQQIRLTAQCEEVRKEKSYVAQMLEDEAKDFAVLQQALQNLFRKQMELQNVTTQNPPSTAYAQSPGSARNRAFSSNDAEVHR